MSWIKDPKAQFEAQYAFESTHDSDDKDAHTILDQWCKTWLSESGWKRLQGNVRQKLYVRGSWKDGRERMRTLQISSSTHRQLVRFADKQKMTINQAIKQMLENND